MNILNMAFLFILLFTTPFCNSYTQILFSDQAVAFHPRELDDSYQYRNDQHDDRYEGIKQYLSKSVTNDIIILLSCIAKTDIPIPNAEADILKIGLYVTEKSLVNISISYEPKLYYVDPIPQIRGPGLYSFCWPTDIIQKHHIPINRLYAKATYRQIEKNIIFPAFFYHDTKPQQIQNYQFVYSPTKRMTLNYWILESETENIIANGTNQIVEKDSDYFIDWNGCDNSGNIVPDGFYILKVQGIYLNRLGRQKVVQKSDQFYHTHYITDSKF